MPGGVLAGFRLGQGPPALLVHGGPFSCTYLTPFAEGLSDRLDCIIYQQRGLPPSSVGGPYSVAGHVADALAVLEAVTAGKVWVIGHSWGGFLAMAIAAAAPARVAGCIPIEATVPAGDAGMESHGRWVGRILTEDQQRQVEQIDAKPLADAPVSLCSTSVSLYWSGYFADPASAPALPDLQINPVCADQSLQDMMRVSERGELAATLRTLDIPALFIMGSASGLRLPGEQFAQTLPRAQTAIIDGAGHFPWIEAPARIRDLVSSFIE